MSIDAQYETTTPAFRLTTAPTTGNAFPATDPSNLGNRPQAVLLQAETQNIRFTTDGSAPTSSYGMILVAGADASYFAGPLNSLRFIQAASGAKLNVTYLTDVLQAAGPQGQSGAQGAAGPTGSQGAASGPLTLPALAALGVYPGGTPYVDVTLNPAALTSAPFYDPGASGPGVVAIPGTAGMVTMIVKAITWCSTGDPWGTPASTQFAFINPGSGLTPFPITDIGDNLTSDLEFNSPWTWKNAGDAEEGAAPESIGADVVMWTTNDVSDGGTGTRSLTVRIFYDLFPGNSPA